MCDIRRCAAHAVDGGSAAPPYSTQRPLQHDGPAASREQHVKTTPLIYRKERRAERVASDLPVRFGVKNLDRSDRARNVSSEGLYIATNDVFKVGSRIDLAIGFPAGETALRGEVIWAIQVPEHLRGSMVYGMGIRIVKADAAWPERFAAWKESLRGKPDHSPK
jgi:hypothetical protein